LSNASYRLLHEQISGDPGELFVRGRQFTAALAFAGGFEDLAEIEKIVIFDTGPVWELPGSQVFQLNRQAGIGAHRRLIEQALGG